MRYLRTEALRHLKERTKMSHFSEGSLSFIRSTISQITVKGEGMREKACLKVT